MSKPCKMQSSGNTRILRGYERMAYRLNKNFLKVNPRQSATVQICIRKFLQRKRHYERTSSVKALLLL